MKKRFSLTLIGLVILFIAQAQDLKTGLVLDMPLHGDTKDYSKFRNNGEAKRVHPTENRFGEESMAYKFNGDGYVSVPNDMSLQFDTAMTISLWASIDFAKYRGMRLVDKVNAGYRQGVCFDTYAGNNDGLRVCIGGSCIESDWGYSLQTWHYMTMVFDKGNIKFYIDGALAGEDQTKYDYIDRNIRPLLLGASQGELARDEFLRGKMSDVKIYNRALNAKEVLHLKENQIFYFPEYKIEKLFPYDIVKQIKAESAELAVFPIEHKNLMLFLINDETLYLYDTKTWKRVKILLTPDIYTLFRLDYTYLIDDMLYIGLDSDGVIDGYLSLDLNTNTESYVDCDLVEWGCEKSDNCISFVSDKSDGGMTVDGYKLLMKDDYLLVTPNAEKMAFNKALSGELVEKIAFTTLYPDSKYLPEMHRAVLAGCKTLDDLSRLGDRYPQYAKEADKRAFKGIEDSNMLVMYEEYLRLFPNGAYTKVALKLKEEARKKNMGRATALMGGVISTQRPFTIVINELAE